MDNNFDDVYYENIVFYPLDKPSEEVEIDENSSRKCYNLEEGTYIAKIIPEYFAPEAKGGIFIIDIEAENKYKFLISRQFDFI